MEKGAFAGYPMSNVKVIVYDGKEHEVDSKPVAFEIAGREAFKIAVQDAGPVLFEPIMNVRVVVPDANMGDVMSDLNTRRGRVQGTESEHGNTRSLRTCRWRKCCATPRRHPLDHRWARLLHDGIRPLRYRS
jgi:elongation factor G